MIKYPEGLPYPQKDGLGFTPANQILRTELTSGRARQRNRFTSSPSLASFTWVFNSTQARLFEAWSAGIGAEWFEMDIITPLGNTPHQVRFTATPAGPKRFGNVHWSYSATLELFERAILPPEWALILPEWILLQPIFDRAMNVEWPESPYQTYGSELDQAINQEWPQYVAV